MKKLLCKIIGHKWVDISNEIILDGEVCMRCGKLKKNDILNINKKILDKFLSYQVYTGFK